MKFSLALRMKWLWLRHAHTFNWAHKPLCERFQKDVLRVGGLYLCRSCTCAYAGLACGALIALIAPLSGALRLGLFLSILVAVLGFSAPPLYKRLPRWIRDILRFLSGALIPVALHVCISVQFWVGAFGLAALLAFWCLYFKLRRTRKLRECDGCLELGSGEICSGFAYQAGHVRRFESEAADLLSNSGFVPECLLSPRKNKSPA